MRYPHYLRPAVGGRWPQRVLAVECASVTVSADAASRSQTERLTHWYCTELGLSGDDYCIAAHSTGRTSLGWWEWLSSQLTDTRSTWIISESCGRIWPLLGLWEEIENGRLVITGTDPHAPADTGAELHGLRQAQTDPLAPVSSGARHSVHARRAGMLVVADPPCILVGRYKERACRFTWVDARNYSVHLPESITRGSDSLAWIVLFWRRYHTLCTAAHLGSAQTTTGSQSLHGWRVGYYTGGVYAGGMPEITDLEQRALIGGRCEAYRIGEIVGPVYHLDIRSAYAAQCVREAVPIRVRSMLGAPDMPALATALARAACIASVRIRTDERAYPYRRVSRAPDTDPTPSGPARQSRAAYGTDIIWPIGEYNTTLCGPELADALAHDRIVRVYSLVEYDSAPILRDYAQRIYDLRCKYESANIPDMARVCKSLLVAIVGKFGQRDRRWVHCPDLWSDLQYGEWYGSDAVGRSCRYRSLGGVIQRDEILGLATEAVPAVAAWILSAARMRLLQLIRIAGWEHTYYCDTDSIMVDEYGYWELDHAGLISPGVLGSLYIHDIWDHVDIRGVKYYVGDGNIVCSGLPRGHCVDVGDGLHYWYTEHAGMQAAHGHRPDSRRVLRRYERSLEYTHGVVRDDGRVDPIRLGE
jgi:hypothetical protein